MSEFLDVAIQAWIEADADFAKAKEAYDKAEGELAVAKNQAQHKADLARKEVETMMAEAGEYDFQQGNVKVAWSTPRQSVKVVDPAAVPDEFCKMERKPKLKEIGEFLKTNECNWASLEYGEKKLQWRFVK